MLGKNELLCVCALIYNNIKGVNSCNDLVQVMERIINCILCGQQVYLMQIELSPMIAPSEKNYQLCRFYV